MHQKFIFRKKIHFDSYKSHIDIKLLIESSLEAKNEWQKPRKLCIKIFKQF